MGKKQRAELLQQLTPLKRQEIWNEPVRVQPSTQAQAVVVAASATTGAEPKQSERASQEQEKLGDISANALKKLALISASRSSNLTPDANPTSTPSGERESGDDGFNFALKAAFEYMPCVHAKRAPESSISF